MHEQVFACVRVRVRACVRCVELMWPDGVSECDLRGSVDVARRLVPWGLRVRRASALNDCTSAALSDQSDNE